MEKNKEILQGHEARLRIKTGIDKACDAVRPTLGVIGMTAIIEYPGLDPLECDDGVTILKNIWLKDHYENIGVQKLRKAAVRTSTEGGDGTATTTVLTQALVNEVFKEIEKDSSKIREVRERLHSGLKEVLEKLSEIKREVTEEDIEKIATISSLDPEVAKLIAEVIKEVGINGVITVEKGAKLGYSKEVVKGARFDKGLLSPYFINDPVNEQTVLEDVYIVLADRRISTNEQVLSILNSIGTGKHILFIADDVDSVALGTLSANARAGVASIACVKNPFSASAARDFLFDMAALTGGTVISEESGMKLDTATKELCGRADKVVVTRDTCTIIGGRSNETLNERISNIQNKIEETTSEYAKKQLQDRLACLTGGIGVIRVGAYTDSEFNAKKYKFDNAIRSTQAALQEGILAGGGIALFDVAKQLESSLFRETLNAPFRQMIKNSGMTDILVTAFSRNKGIDFKSKKEVDMFESGIIDPFKVTRLALESATAIASDLCSIETAIVIEEDGKTGG